MHYQRYLKRDGDLGGSEAVHQRDRLHPKTKNGGTCSAEGCDEDAFCRGLCRVHYRDLRKVQLRAGHVRRTYGLSLERYDELLEAQSGRCANKACGRIDPGGYGAFFCVDHDHNCCEETSSCGDCVRGLLCWNCNIALGHLRDDPEVIRGLADYLESFDLF
jgi:hypothetical protein